jgi:hypothetical protein
MTVRNLLGVVLLGVTSIYYSASCQAQVDFRRSDSNGDEQFDISDSEYTLNYLFLGAPGPGSLASADANDDGAINITDAIYTLTYLFSGGSEPPPPFPDPGPDPFGWLESITYPSNVVGQGSSLGFSGPPQVMAPAGSAVEVPVSVVLTAQGDVQAWSLGVQASGNGNLAYATTQGTVGADVNDIPPGLRDNGYEITELAAGGAVSAVDLSLISPVVLPDGSSNTVLNLTLEGAAPSAGSSETWGLQFVDGIQGSGQPVQNIVSVGGLSFVPTLGSYRVEVIGVPEPSTLVLGALGLLSLGMVGWRRRKRA